MKVVHYYNVRNQGRFASRIDLVRRQMRDGEQQALCLDKPVRLTPRQRLVAAMVRMGVAR